MNWDQLCKGAKQSPSMGCCVRDVGDVGDMGMGTSVMLLRVVLTLAQDSHHAPSSPILLSWLSWPHGCNLGVVNTSREFLN